MSPNHTKNCCITPVGLVPQIRTTSFQSHPPLIAFQWGVGPPLLNTSLYISCSGVAKEYMLRGVIYYDNQHFTAHFLNSTGSSWHHNGMARSGVLILQNPSQSQLASALAVRGLVKTPLFIHVYTRGCQIYSQSAISKTPSLTYYLQYTRIPLYLLV